MASRAGLTQKASVSRRRYSAMPSCCHSLQVFCSRKRRSTCSSGRKERERDAQSPRRLAGVRAVAQDGQRELLEGRVVVDDLLQERDGACCGRLGLAGFAEAAQVEEGVDGVVLDLLRAAATSERSALMRRCRQREEDVLRRGDRGRSGRGARRASRSRRPAEAARARRAASTSS